MDAFHTCISLGMPLLAWADIYDKTIFISLQCILARNPTSLLALHGLRDHISFNVTACFSFLTTLYSIAPTLFAIRSKFVLIQILHSYASILTRPEIKLIAMATFCLFTAFDVANTTRNICGSIVWGSLVEEFIDAVNKRKINEHAKRDLENLYTEVQETECAAESVTDDQSHHIPLDNLDREMYEPKTHESRSGPASEANAQDIGEHMWVTYTVDNTRPKFKRRKYTDCDLD